MRILGFDLPFLSKHKVVQGDRNVAHFGFGTAGGGVKIHGKGAFYEELKSKNIEVIPYSYYCFQSGDKRDDLPDMQKDAFGAIKKFDYCKDSIDKVFNHRLRRHDVGIISTGTGGGSGSVAIMASQLARNYTHKVVLRIFIDENLFLLGGKTGDRKYINTLAQFSLLKKHLTLNPELKLDLITSVSLRNSDRFGTFTEIDRAVHNIDVALVAQGITRINEILGNPEYRFKTYSLDIFDAGLGAVALGNRMDMAIKNMGKKTFFDPSLFMEDGDEPSPVGDPLIIVYGPEQVVSNLELSLSAEQSGQIFRTIFASRERQQAGVPYSSIEQFGIDNPRSVFLIGVHPISEEWWLSKLKTMNDDLIAKISKCKPDKSSSNLCETIHTMANQSKQTLDQMIKCVS